MMEGFRRPKNLRRESKWHISHLVRLSQPFTALKIIKKVELSVLEEAILSLDMPTIDQLLGPRVIVIIPCLSGDSGKFLALTG
jgi:hypothetical protein